MASPLAIRLASFLGQDLAQHVLTGERIQWSLDKAGLKVIESNDLALLISYVVEPPRSVESLNTATILVRRVQHNAGLPLTPLTREA